MDPNLAPQPDRWLERPSWNDTDWVTFRPNFGVSTVRQESLAFAPVKASSAQPIGR